MTTTTNKADNYAKSRLNDVLAGLRDPIKYITLSGVHEEVYALLKVGSNGAWMVVRGGRPSEASECATYIVCHPPSAPREHRSLLVNWCTCEGYRRRQNCRHLHLVCLAAKI